MATRVNMVPATATGRKTRSPRHQFQVRHRPFLLQPFMIAPVLPGETMKSLLLQSRAVTKPVKNPLTGWWLEYYFFYVKHRDLEGRDDFSEMMLDLDKDLTAYDQASAASLPFYAAVGDRKWLELCYNRIVEEYFRNEGEVVSAIDNLAPVKINMDGIANSAVLDDDFVAPADVALTVGGDDAVTASEIDAMMRTWDFQRAHGLTAMDYEDWLGTYGIRTAPAENHRPELIRYVREWQYPSNTVDPATGSPSSAVSWAVSQRGDKDRFFREPGFLVGVTVARAKIYLSEQTGAAVGHLKTALDWLPALLRDDPYTSVRKFAETGGPFPIVSDSNGYWLDLKDLFIYGDQFVNFDRASTDGAFVALPTAGFNTLYPSSADINALFVGTTDATRYVAQDGVVQLAILGALEDTTPQLRRIT